MLPIKF